MKKKKWVLLLLSLVIILAASGAVYNHLSITYAQKNTEEGGRKEETKKEDVKEETMDAAAKEKAEDFTVYDKNENEVKLSDYIGKPLIVNFWASWCPPCKNEMPLFQDAINNHGEEITFLMVNETDGERETMDTAQKFLDDNGYHMNLLFDLKGDAEMTYNLFYLPRTLFIDENGNIVADHVGELTESELTDTISKMLYQ